MGECKSPKKTVLFGMAIGLIYAFGINLIARHGIYTYHHGLNIIYLLGYTIGIGAIIFNTHALLKYLKHKSA